LADIRLSRTFFGGFFGCNYKFGGYSEFLAAWQSNFSASVSSVVMALYKSYYYYYLLFAR